MKKILTEQSQTTPEIIFDTIDNTLSIKGKLITFEPNLFWSLIFHQVEKLNIKTVEFELEYITTNSIPYILQIIKKYSPKVVWLYRDFDDDMLELGENLDLLSDSFFEFIEFENQKEKICL